MGTESFPLWASHSVFPGPVMSWYLLSPLYSAPWNFTQFSLGKSFLGPILPSIPPQ